MDWFKVVKYKCFVHLQIKKSAKLTSWRQENASWVKLEREEITLNKTILKCSYTVSKVESDI